LFEVWLRWPNEEFFETRESPRHLFGFSRLRGDWDLSVLIEGWRTFRSLK